MKSWFQILAGGLLVASIVLMAACDDSDLVPEETDTLDLRALPSTVTIDISDESIPLEDSTATTTLQVTVLNQFGVPVEGVGVTFSTTSGTLAGGSGEDMSFSNRETDSDGRATDVLTISALDPEPIEVTASSGSLENTVTVTRQFQEPNSDPQVDSITASPANIASQNQRVTFTPSITDPDGDLITCYKWTVEFDNGRPTEVTQGTTRALFSENFDLGLTGGSGEQPVDITVTLLVSDDPSFNALSCPSRGPTDSDPIVPDVDLSPFGFSLPYSVVCDTSPPTINAGTDLVVQLEQGQSTTADITFTGSANDNDSGISLLDWGPGQPGACNTGTTVDDSLEGQGVITCRFTASTTLLFQATNGCGDVVTDTLRVTVLPAPAR